MHRAKAEHILSAITDSKFSSSMAIEMAKKYTVEQGNIELKIVNDLFCLTSIFSKLFLLFGEWNFER